MLSSMVTLVWMLTISMTVAEDLGHSKVRAIPVHGIQKYGEPCESPGGIDSIYQFYQDLKIPNPAERDEKLKNSICQETLGLQCISTVDRRKVDVKGEHQMKFTCQCFDPFYPDHASSELVYDHAAGECRAKVRSPCVSGYYKQPDSNIFWRYDRKPFNTNYNCVKHAKCQNVTESLAKVFLEKIDATVCVCNPGWLPNETGHCYYPKETENFQVLFPCLILLVVAWICGFVIAAIDSERTSSFSPIPYISLKKTINIDFLGFLDEPELPKHWYNSDGTEKSYNAIKKMLLIKKHIFEMKHTCFWKFGVFVRFEDDTEDITAAKNYSKIQSRKRQKQERQRLLKDIDSRKVHAINSMDKKVIKSEFTFVRNYQEKKRHYQIRSCLNEKNEVLIRHIQEVPDEEFLKFIDELKVPTDYQYSSYSSDHYETNNIEYIEDVEPSRVMNVLQESTAFTPNGFIKLRL